MSISSIYTFTILQYIPNAYLTRLETDHMAEEDSYNSIRKSDNVVSRISSDFQCFVCGAIFTTHEDKKQHLEKEEHGKLHWWYYIAENRDCKISRTPKSHKRL